MAYTGYKIIQYIDDNPNSPTYGQTWEERELSSSCSDGSINQWVLVSSECELVTSGFTGDRINIYYNDATGEYSSNTVSDSSCSASSNDENWINIGEVYCEQDEDGIYSGWGIQEQKQVNSNLLNYGEIRKTRVSNADCSGYTEPDWEDISTNCHIVADELTCYLTFDGTADILQIDVNPSSPSFNHTRTITGESEDCFCEACDRVEYEWRYVDDICGIQMPSNYGLTGLTDDTVYHVYRQYGTCIIDGQSGRTKPTNVYSAVTYQTGVTDCVYRWVDTDDYVCQEFNLKFIANYQGGQTYSAECDGNTTLTSADTRPSGYEYSSMTGVVIGDCVETIGASAFTFSSGLTSIDIPSGITTIDRFAFYRCSGLTSIHIPDSVTSIGSNAFASCSGLTSVNIPTGLTSIPESLFDYDSNIDGTLEIPNGVTSIGHYAFYDCRNLDALICRPVVPPTIGNEILGGNTSCPIYVPCDSVEAYKSAWSNYASRIEAISGTCFEGKFKATYQGGQTYSAECDGNTTLTTATTKPSGYEYSAMTSAQIGNCVTSFGYNTFQDCSGLTSINIPNSVTSMGYSTFYNCSSLTSCTIGSGLTSISLNTFSGCYSLTGITIPNNITSIGGQAFQYCSGLTSINIPNSVTSIGNRAFISCSSLTSITIPNSVTSIGSLAFAVCSGLTSINIPSGVTSIGESTFSSCRSLTSINIPSGVTSIGESAFRYCSSLTSIDIPSGVTTINRFTFEDCSGLTSIDIPDSVTSISANAFNNCSSLTSCTIGSGVTSIGDWAFRLCSSLTSINIPSGVTSIGSLAFFSCGGLTSIIVNATTPPTLGNYAYDNTNNCPIYVPSGSVNAYQTAWSNYSSRIRAIGS